MTEAELRKIKARVSPTICDTYRSENGYAEARIEGRISKADFDALCDAVASEREACAKLAEADTSFDMLQDFGMQSHSAQLRKNIAEAIRNRT